MLYYSLGLVYPTNLNRLILLQKRIIRIVNKKPFDAHTDPLFRDSKFLKFVHIKFMYSCNNNLLTPSFSYFLFCTNQVHSYNTHGSNRSYIPFCQKGNFSSFTKVQFSLISYVDIRNSLSLYSFQSKIKDYFLSCY